MTEIVQLQRQGTDPYALLSNAVKQYEESLRQEGDDQVRRQQLDIQRGQLDLGNRELSSSDTYRKGQLQQGQDTLEFQKNVEAAKNTLTLWQKRMDEGDPTVQPEAAQYLHDHPEQERYLAAAAQFHATYGQQAKGIAEQKHVADNTAVAGGSTDPNANAIYTHDVTNAFPTPQMFTQQQSMDLGKRAATPGGAPNLKATVPKPSGNSVGDFEARSVGALTDATQNQTSQTQKDVQAISEAGATKRTAMTIQGQKDIAAQKTIGADVGQAKVDNVVNAIRGAVNNGRDASAILKSIPDKKIKQAVSDELSKPENAALYQASLIPSAARESIAQIDPLIMQARKVQKAYAPYKGDNGLIDRDTIDYGLYRAGKKPPDDSPISEVANTQMLAVQAGARLLKGGSRAYPALKMAMQHAPDGAIDTRAQIYDKSGKLLTQLVNVHNSELGWDGQSPEPPIGALRSFPNGAMGRWDGHGWVEQ